MSNRRKHIAQQDQADAAMRDTEAMFDTMMTAGAEVGRQRSQGPEPLVARVLNEVFAATEPIGCEHITDSPQPILVAACNTRIMTCPGCKAGLPMVLNPMCDWCGEVPATRSGASSAAYLTILWALCNGCLEPALGADAPE